MTRTAYALSYAYLLVSLLTLDCAVTSARNSAPLYAAGLATATLLFVVAAVREHMAADERRAEAVRVERAARLRAMADGREMRRAADTLAHACCERWWTSCGTQHASTCTHTTRKDISR
ncbi:hypothetical protein AB0G76_36840 [Streptomyces asoensis]|uniref:hypothetical protein n=1 Tax=Streptomyces asoensis TaxID=249586 RepID=UPI0033C13E55